MKGGDTGRHVRSPVRGLGFIWGLEVYGLEFRGLGCWDSKPRVKVTRILGLELLCSDAMPSGLWAEAAGLGLNCELAKLMLILFTI